MPGEGLRPQRYAGSKLTSPIQSSGMLFPRQTPQKGSTGRHRTFGTPRTTLAALSTPRSPPGVGDSGNPDPGATWTRRSAAAEH